mgnify:CR=1 FL=1
MKTLILALIILLTSCSSHQKVQRGPEGFRKDAIMKGHIRPTDVPIINLEYDNVPAFWSATATTINTNSFQNKNQLKGHVPGYHPRPSKFLPPHKKPKFDETGPPNQLRAGLGQSSTLIYEEASFDTLGQTGWNPPDPSLAVGPEHIVVTVNMAIAFYDKEGNEQFSSNLDSSGDPGFFEEVGGGSFTFDPKCFYDPHNQRFVVLALEQYDDEESWITIAISDDSDPNGIWYKYRTWSVITDESNGNTYWVDYPGFGFDDGYYYVTGNLFGLNNGSFGGALYRVYEAAPMLNGEPVVIADVRKAGHASVQGTQHWGSSPAAFFVGRRNNTELRISHISNPANPSVVSEFVAVPNHSTPSGVQNNGGTLSALDGRIMNAQYRDGSLWTAHGILGTGVDAVGRWYEIDVSNWPTTPPVLAQSGDTTVLGLSSFFPAIAPNKRGEVAAIVATATDDANPTLHIIGRKVGDQPGVMGTPTLVAESTDGAEGRWGDYFDLTVDPNNETRFWYVGEYRTPSGWQTCVGSAVITCLEDIDANGFVNISDLLGLISEWGTDGSGSDVSAPYDIIDISDLLAVISALGTCP